MSSVRIGFVGVGKMGQCAHLKNYVTVPECEVVAIAELRPELARKVAARYGVPRVYADHREMLRREHLDAIVAPQPFTVHGRLIPELLQARVPVFIEKPLAGSIEWGEKILRAAEDAGTWVMVGYHRRSDPAVAHARAEIERLKQSGELGKLRYVRSLVAAGDWVAGGYADLIRSEEPVPALERDPCPGDMDAQAYAQYTHFTNFYIHQINLLRHLLGEQYDVTYADPSGVLFAGLSRSGVACAIEMSPYSTTLDWQESVLVGFQHGYIKIEVPAPLVRDCPGRVEILRDPRRGVTPVIESPDLPRISAMRQQAINFVAAVRGEMEPPCEAAEALQDLKVAREYLRLWKGV